MSPEEYIEKAIIELARSWRDENAELTDEEIKGSNDYYDAKNEFRDGEVETEIPSESSRHYESKSVAAQIDGVYVGWTYWYGGGKHSEAESIDWISDAYFLDCVEEEKLLTVRTFTKK